MHQNEWHGLLSSPTSHRRRPIGRVPTYPSSSTWCRPPRPLSPYLEQRRCRPGLTESNCFPLALHQSPRELGTASGQAGKGENVGWERAKRHEIASCRVWTVDARFGSGGSDGEKDPIVRGFVMPNLDIFISIPFALGALAHSTRNSEHHTSSSGVCALPIWVGRLRNSIQIAYLSSPLDPFGLYTRLGTRGAGMLPVRLGPHRWEMQQPPSFRLYHRGFV